MINVCLRKSACTGSAISVPLGNCCSNRKRGFFNKSRNCSNFCGYSIAVVTSTETEGREEMFYLTTHSTHFIYGYMASDIW